MAFTGGTRHVVAVLGHRAGSDHVTGWRSVLLRGGLALMVLDHLQNAIWAAVSPTSYYARLSGAITGSETEPLNQLMTRDLAVDRVALAGLLILAAWSLDTRVLRVALVIASAIGLGRLSMHLLSSTGEAWMQWTGMTIGAALPLLLLTLVPRTNEYSADRSIEAESGTQRIP